jgi:endonuclease/exonuclease/phosphatase family metal-dependent hydrolase
MAGLSTSNNSTSVEMLLDARSPSAAPLMRCWQALGRHVNSSACLRPMRPALSRLLAVTEPAGRLWFQATPARLLPIEQRALTIVSANLWHDWPRHRELSNRLESFATLVEATQADIVLLQEVSRTTRLRVDEWLSNRWQMAHAYARANGHETGIGFEEGLAIFSRFPLIRPHLLQLGPGNHAFVRRLALGAAIQTPFGQFLAISVHLGLRRRQNAAQLTHLQAWVSALTGAQPALIGGDFNSWEHAPQIARAQAAWIDTFRRLHPYADATTHEIRWPWGKTLRRHRLDYVFLQPGPLHWNILEARHVDASDGPHSDHRAVLVRLAPAV